MSFIPRIYIDPDLSLRIREQDSYVLSLPVTHYLGNVLRLRAGDTVILFNNQDGEWLCMLEGTTKGKGTAIVQKQLRLPILINGPTLLFSPLKRDAMDLAIRMATELGVQVIQPVQTMRTNSHRIREERLRNISIEAAEQSNRLSVPEIRSMDSLFSVCDKWPQDRKLLVTLERGKERKIAISHASSYTGNEGVMIGPEGGFDEREVQRLLSYDFVVPLSLGDLILKAETAVVAGLAKLFPYVRA